jgi:hypothetical protein
MEILGERKKPKSLFSRSSAALLALLLGVRIH